MFEFLFIDLDETVLDFHAEERVALCKTFLELGLEPTDEVLARYSQINREHWDRLERREITREQVLVGRYEQLLSEYGIDREPVACARTYEKNLSLRHCFLPGAEDALKALSKKYKLYLASNGTEYVQVGRIASAGIEPYFQEIFISQRMGADKPSPDYFKACFAKIPGFAIDRALMVGDSLPADIGGAKAMGMATCWVNPKGKPHGETKPDYEIKALSELEGLLDRIDNL
jgi:2-haloacid dehalogenase